MINNGLDLARWRQALAAADTELAARTDAWRASLALDIAGMQGWLAMEAPRSQPR